MNYSIRVKTALSVICSLPFALASLGGALPPLFENSMSEWKVVVATNAAPSEKFGAEEFVEAIAKISGVRLETVGSVDGVEHGVIVSAKDCGDNFAEEKVEYRLERGNLLLTGNQPRAALHAVYAFLQRELDVRWLWPGADGEVMPSLKRWSFPDKFGYKHTPSIKYRGFHHCGDWRGRNDFNLWQTRNFAVIHRHGVTSAEEKYGQYSMPSMHNANLNGDKELFATHPECFAELSGHRSMANICFSSDLGARKVAERIGNDIATRQKHGIVDIISIFPNDNQDYCQCEKCKPLGVSTSWFRYFNKVVDILHERFPDLRFATLAYQGYLNVPDCKFNNVEFIEYASHPRCIIHKWADATCNDNVSELKRLREWTARGDVKIGHYAYEYDNGGSHSVFLPFFSIIDDAVATCAKEGLVTSIPEVSLSPKAGPDVKAHAIQNRLSTLLYAWKMWDAEMTLDDFYDDMTSHAFGPSAAEMKEYFKLLDAAWLAQPGRIHLFADGMNISSALLSKEETRSRAEKLLATAEAKAKADARCLANVMREKTLYRQFTDYRELRIGNSVSVNVPRLGDGEPIMDQTAPWHSLDLASPSGKGEGKIKVRAAWSPKELDVEWLGAKDSASFVLTADSGEKFSFAYDAGVKKSHRISEVGVGEQVDETSWTVLANGDKLAFSIPLSLFTQQPRPGDRWGVRFASGNEALPVREDMTVKFNFIPAPAADRPIVYVIPSLKNQDQRRSFLNGVPSVRDSAEQDGWKLLVATNGTQLAEIAGKAKDYMFLVPVSQDVSPEVAAIIGENVRNGGTLIARSWSSVPLDKILGDASLKSHVAAPKDYPLSERHAKYVKEGDWCKTPWNIERNIRNTFSPCYMQVGTEPAGAWVEYASMPSAADESQMIPFLTATKYGKGLVILVGETLHVSHFRLIDNLRKDLL